MAVDISKLVGQTPDPEENERAMSEVPVDEDFAEYVFLLGVELLEEGGLGVLQKAVQQSGDPIVVIAQFIVQMVTQLAETLAQETNFDPRVMLVRGGFVDSISDFIVKKLQLGEEASDMIEQEVLELVKALATGETKPSQDGSAGLEQQAAAGPAPAPAAGGIESMAGGMGL